MFPFTVATRTHYLLLTTHYSPLTTYYSLLTTYYSLLTHFYLLLTAYCLHPPGVHLTAATAEDFGEAVSVEVVVIKTLHSPRWQRSFPPLICRWLKRPLPSDDSALSHPFLQGVAAMAEMFTNGAQCHAGKAGVEQPTPDVAALGTLAPEVAALTQEKLKEVRRRVRGSTHINNNLRRMWQAVITT